jgi:hypothetical protein
MLIVIHDSGLVFSHRLLHTVIVSVGSFELVCVEQQGQHNGPNVFGVVNM